MVQHPEREDCYIARLVVKKVSPADSRRYFLHVENAHGTDRYAVELNVKGKYSKKNSIKKTYGIRTFINVMMRPAFGRPLLKTSHFQSFKNYALKIETDQSSSLIIDFDQGLEVTLAPFLVFNILSTRHYFQFQNPFQWHLSSVLSSHFSSFLSFWS